MPPEPVVAELRSRLSRHDPDRYPVQHATAAFHLATVLLQAGELEEADRLLATAAALFPEDHLPVEHAKALNMRGVVARSAGRPQDAAQLFERAAALFAQTSSVLEEAASRHNLGLVRRELDAVAEAARDFTAALDIFRDADARTQAAAAARELGATLLASGRLEEAAEALHEARDLARRAGDRAALGAAANVLGIVHLAAGDPGGARACFEDAAGAHPRNIRPDQYAMARANLALACLRAGLPAHACLAARQALALPQAAPDVVAQARAVLQESGEPADALIQVLRSEDPARHVGVLRAELARLSTAADRGGHDDAWVRALASDPAAASALAEAWLEVVLEQPPDAFARTVDATTTALAGLPEDVRQRVQHTLATSMAKFHLPQWERLRAAFRDAASTRGLDTTWL